MKRFLGTALVASAATLVVFGCNRDPLSSDTKSLEDLAQGQTLAASACRPVYPLTSRANLSGGTPETFAVVREQLKRLPPGAQELVFERSAIEIVEKSRMAGLCAGANVPAGALERIASCRSQSTDGVTIYLVDDAHELAKATVPAVGMALAELQLAPDNLQTALGENFGEMHTQLTEGFLSDFEAGRYQWSALAGLLPDAALSPELGAAARLEMVRAAVNGSSIERAMRRHLDDVVLANALDTHYCETKDAGSKGKYASTLAVLAPLANVLEKGSPEVMARLADKRAFEATVLAWQATWATARIGGNAHFPEIRLGLINKLGEKAAGFALQAEDSLGSGTGGTVVGGPSDEYGGQFVNTGDSFAGATTAGAVGGGNIGETPIFCLQDCGTGGFPTTAGGNGGTSFAGAPTVGYDGGATTVGFDGTAAGSSAGFGGGATVAAAGQAGDVFCLQGSCGRGGGPRTRAGTYQQYQFPSGDRLQMDATGTRGVDTRGNQYQYNPQSRQWTGTSRAGQRYANLNCPGGARR